MLPEGAAQRALDVNHERGTIRAMRDDLAVHEASPGSSADFYLHKGTDWLTFGDNVDVAPGPVADDRLYITQENGNPIIKDMGNGGAEYPLAIDAPLAPPIISLNTSSGEETGEDVVFVYTWVTIFDEESLPSPPSSPLTVPEGSSIDISLVDSEPPFGRRINRFRVYRSMTTALGATELFFVKELNAGTSLYVHDPLIDHLQELLPTANYDPAPDGLQGITSMNAGNMAAFKGKSLRFCEPYKPHAWPQQYELLASNDIVGLVTFGNMLAVLTTGEPYIVQGTDPANMIMEKIEQNAPCLSKDGIVDLGYAAAYPSTDGVITLSQSGAQNVTRGLFTRDEWRSFSPETISAGALDGGYVFTCLPEGSFQRETAMISLNAQSPSYIRTSAAAEKMRFDIYTGNLHYIDAAGMIRELASTDAGFLSVEWQSAQFHLPTVTSFGVIVVEGDELDDPSGFLARVYRDGQLHTTITTLNEPARLAPGLGRRWSVKIEGKVEVSRVTLAGDVAEVWS